MCNKIHWDKSTKAITSFGKGYKLFSGTPDKPRWILDGKKEVPELNKFDREKLEYPHLYVDVDDSQLGFCFFTTYEKARKVAKLWLESDCGWLNILPIYYTGGLAEFDETNMIAGKTVRASLCKEFSLKPPLGV